MVKIRIVIIIVLFFVISCESVVYMFHKNVYKINKNRCGEPVLSGKVQYTLSKPSIEDLKKVDTMVYYIQVFEDGYYNDEEKRNPEILRFHNDGYFSSGTILHYEKFDKVRDKNSIYYGGKWRIVKNIIELEKFYPVSPSKTNFYERKINKGYIIDNKKIIFKNRMYMNGVYEKREILFSDK